jgi:uncharacterized radical SAM superfamily Fe-S cluster-containing enzyme
MMRKVRPYLFYDTTTSVCGNCLRVVEAKILLKDSDVFLEKWCPAHGTQRVLIADDAEYYRACREVFVKPPEMPHMFNTRMKYGCPFDCGLCPDHMQHSCLTLVEITDRCNLSCPVCFANSGPHRLRHKPREDIERMLDAVVCNEGEPDVVQISGGEPTVHPDLLAVLDSARARPIRHLMLNTNGIRIARDPDLAARLAKYAKGFEVYLQFDSLREEPLHELRGADLRGIHLEALARLNEFGISTTLVMTVKKGVNDSQIGEVIDFALTQPCVRGVTLQPIQQAGRTEHYDVRRHRITVSEVRREIARQTPLFSMEDIVPVPCNPDTLAMAYALKLGSSVVPLTRYLDPKILLDAARNTVSFEHEPELRARIFGLFSTDKSPESQASCLADLLCCLPRVEAPPSFTYSNVFRVLIVQFMDAHNLDIRALKKSCVHIAQPDGRLIPFESFNLFYRDSNADKLATLRAEIMANVRARMAQG